MEEEALQTLMAKKKAEDMRAQLKSIIIMSRGMGAWDELLKTEGDIRKRRQKAIYAQKEKQRKFMEWTAITIGVAIFGSFLFWLLTLALKAQGLI